MSKTEGNIRRNVASLFANLPDQELPSSRVPSFRPGRDAEPGEPASAVVVLQLEDIDPDIVQVRYLVGLDYLKQLAEQGNEWAIEQLVDLQALGEHLCEHGQIQPIRVYRAPRGRPYRVLVGHRRLFAATLAGMQTIQAIVDPEEPDELTKLDLQIGENLQRRNFNDMERAMIIERYRGALQGHGGPRDTSVAAESVAAEMDSAIAARLAIKPRRMLQLQRLTRFAGSAQIRIVETGWPETVLRPLLRAVERLKLDEATQNAALAALASRAATNDGMLTNTMVAEHVRQLEQARRAATSTPWVVREIRYLTNASREVVRLREQFSAGGALPDEERANLRAALDTLQHELLHTQRQIFGETQP